ncbi:transketolase [Rhodohalobacter sulfatireducens]|uniref:Transketolase n=1 Tax=Rhodohalobacter sulfatireducens TaxID=2911366 RepID=A0ABS9KBE4_9BACT|nr:transketolase [Rhodohalobacter sulfatireducens]MCG2588157.1 transketolase [Rhodohalobacter sulfatireducens]
MSTTNSIDQACVNTIRGLAMDAVQQANSGHPGMPMGMADVAYVLWTKFLKHNPKNPQWFDRDRFILSAGHGSMLLYSLLHLTGYNVPLEELINFRQLGSITPGHPEYGLTPGVETTTGPLGQGFGTGVGMAIAEEFMAGSFNKDQFELVDHYTYAIVSDGDLMEGISHESASLAGHLKLSKLIYLYDSNKISIDGSTDLAFTDNTKQRFEAYGWDVQVIDGHDHEQIERAIKKAQSTDTPSLIECKSKIGFGSPNKEGTAASHGAPLGEDEIKITKEKLGLDPNKKFQVSDAVYEKMKEAVEAGSKLEEKWNEKLIEFKKQYPAVGASFNKFLSREMPDNWDEVLPVFEADPKGMATRKSSGKVLNEIGKYLHNLIGGSADLAGSNKTELEEESAFSAENRLGRNFHFGVREHGMAAALNGLALHGGVIPYGGTFLVFSDYNKPSIRIAALSEIPSIFVFTHDSIGLGEDGPTHQPIEHLAALRATPNVHVYRPADANETAICWKSAIEREHGPSLLVLTRQSLPTLDRSVYEDVSGTEKGAYILKKENSDTPDLILMSTGSEVHLALEAAEKLEDSGKAVRVVSMPCIEIFKKQSDQYQNEILPPSVKKRISIEAAATLGWYRWVGSEGIAMGLDQFGTSAPYEEAYEELGLTVDAIIDNAESLLA